VNAILCSKWTDQGTVFPGQTCKKPKAFKIKLNVMMTV